MIPAAFVDRSHADAILTISNSTFPESVWAEVLGPGVAALPYVKPGFDLARQILAFHRAGAFARHDAIVPEHHGLFTWNDEAKASYDRHIALVVQAQDWLESRFGKLEPGAPLQEDPLRLARLRRAVGAAAGRPPARESVPAKIDPETLEALARSAARYGLSVEDYKRRNLMKAPARSSDVAEAALALVDGGDDRAI